jgi:multisubunit Na+/H+ antiporter MnhB subunit
VSKSVLGSATVAGFAAILTLIVVGLAAAIVVLPVDGSARSPNVAQSMDQSGAKNPVTAVLLNFRAYDTLLELTVMMLAVLGARALTNGRPGGETQDADVPFDPLLNGFVRLITPIMIVVAGYLLWVGGHAPGGAFQAGAILAALGVLLQLAGFRWWRYLPAWIERILLTAGVAVFLAVGVGTMSPERHFLEYPTAWAKWLILLIEVVAAVSIASILVALYRSGSLRSTLPTRRQTKRGE